MNRRVNASDACEASGIPNARRLSYLASGRSDSTSRSSDIYCALRSIATTLRTLRRLASLHRDQLRSVRFLSKCASYPLMRRERFDVTAPK